MTSGSFHFLLALMGILVRIVVVVVVVVMLLLKVGNMVVDVLDVVHGQTCIESIDSILWLTWSFKICCEIRPRVKKN